MHRNFVFDLCDADSIDGAVILGGALGNALGPSAVDALCARLAPLPMASLALGPPGRPLPDRSTRSRGCGRRSSTCSMRHGCRRIAFIRGPAVNAEAERRYAIYRAVLDRARISRSIRRSICEGTFEKGSGEAAVELLVDERRVHVRRPRRLQRLHGAGRDGRARGARSAGPLRRRGDRLRRHRGGAVLDAAAHHRPAAALPAGGGGARSGPGAARRAAGRAARERADGAGGAAVVRLPLRPGPSRPRRPGHHDRDAGRQPAGRARRGSAAGDRARGARLRHRAPRGLGSPAARRLRGRAARRRRRPVRLDARPAARPASSPRATTWRPGSG